MFHVFGGLVLFWLFLAFLPQIYVLAIRCLQFVVFGIPALIIAGYTIFAIAYFCFNAPGVAVAAAADGVATVAWTPILLRRFFPKLDPGLRLSVYLVEIMATTIAIAGFTF